MLLRSAWPIKINLSFHMKYLVTGALGFIGSQVVELLNDCGHKGSFDSLFVGYVT